MFRTKRCIRYLERRSEKCENVFRKKVFFEMLNLCKIGMGEYPQGELVIPVNSGTISFSSKAEKSLKCESLYIVTCNTSTHYYM